MKASFFVSSEDELGIMLSPDEEAERILLAQFSKYRPTKRLFISAYIVAVGLAGVSDVRICWTAAKATKKRARRYK